MYLLNNETKKSYNWLCWNVTFRNKTSFRNAEKGANVICFDQDEENINKLNLLNVDIDEPYLFEKMKKYKDRSDF